MTFPRFFFVTCLAVTLAIYGTMVLWGLPRLMDSSGGLAPFDLRMLGYSGEEARTYLAAISAEGRAFYLNVIGRLDSVFPPLLALSLILCFIRLAGQRTAALLSAVAVAAAVMDLLENAGIARMLEADPATVTDAMVASISRWTVLKWAADGLTLGALVVLLGLALGRRFRKRS